MGNMAAKYLLTLLAMMMAVCGDSTADTAEVLARVRERYINQDFSANFSQTSVLKAMDITDTAAGTLMVSPPGNMRWQYIAPDPQLIITNGETLWFHKPDENQVMIGKPPTIFGEGKGAGFLADITELEKNFRVSTLDQLADEDSVYLKLIPEKENPDLAKVLIQIDRTTAIIRSVTTYNAFDDETRIELSDVQFRPLANELFTFELPEGTDVVSLGEN
jgi:outer membrane lipoprotein carrier protein